MIWKIWSRPSKSDKTWGVLFPVQPDLVIHLRFFLKNFQEKFALSKNVRIFAVQYRGIEQLVARRAHNPEAGGSSPPPATNEEKSKGFSSFFIIHH